MERIEGRGAVVIGGGSGIGRGIALGLARASARTIVADIDADSAASVAEELRSLGAEAHSATVDATSRAPAPLAETSAASRSRAGCQVAARSRFRVSTESQDRGLEDDRSAALQPEAKVVAPGAAHPTKRLVAHSDVLKHRLCSPTGDDVRLGRDLLRARRRREPVHSRHRATGAAHGPARRAWSGMGMHKK